MDRIFLDANVLFSAAYRPEAPLERLWRLEDARLVTCSLAVHEALRNLTAPEQRSRLRSLLTSVEVVDVAVETSGAGLPRNISLPAADRAILWTAVCAAATHLLTGDKAHFGPYRGRRVEGVLVLPPGAYIRTRSQS